MARYTLKVCYGTEVLELFTRRQKRMLVEILSHEKYDKAGETGPFGEPQKNPDRFEILNTQMEKIHVGNIKETLFFVDNLR